VDYAVWNTLHDGTIESIEGRVPGELRLRVGIAYLCDKLPTASSSLIVHISGCTHFEYAPFGEEKVADLSKIATCEVEILNARAIEDRIFIGCASGQLSLSYENVSTSLVEGSYLSQQDLEAAAQRYWGEWKEKARRARG